MELTLASEDFLEIIRRRSSPGILIFGLDNRVVYSNREALSFFADPENLPEEVIQLCDQAKAYGAPASNCSLLRQKDSLTYSLRTVLIGGPASDHPATHVMVLVEKVIENHDLNLRKARSEFGLSPRETEVVVLLAHGLTNKEIGCKLFLSEHTVKDHRKNIMRKMGVSSRSDILAMLK
jgi:DNA-binding CsgD family transcriptional regulator